MLDYLKIRPEQQIYTYCGGGVAASAPFFALKFILGYPNVKLYSESEMGWLSDERDLPYWTYDAPFLMRDSKWLQWSGGQPIRTYHRRTGQRRGSAACRRVQSGACALCTEHPRRCVQKPSRQPPEAGGGSGRRRSRRVARGGGGVRRGADHRLGPGVRHAGETRSEEGLRLHGLHRQMDTTGVRADEGPDGRRPQEGARRSVHRAEDVSGEPPQGRHHCGPEELPGASIRRCSLHRARTCPPGRRTARSCTCRTRIC